MTTPDPIEAAIAEAHIAISPLLGGEGLYHWITAAAIRAAAPILIAAGREEAAEAILADHMWWESEGPDPAVHMSKRRAVRIARGGTP